MRGPGYRGCAAHPGYELLQRHAARADRARPLVYLAADERAEIFGRALLRRGDRIAEPLVTLARHRPVERIAHRLVEAAHDALGRTRGSDERVPAGRVEIREALLVGGGEIRQHGRALVREDRDRLDLLGLNLGQRG